MNDEYRSPDPNLEIQYSRLIMIMQLGIKYTESIFLENIFSTENIQSLLRNKVQFTGILPGITPKTNNEAR